MYASLRMDELLKNLDVSTDGQIDYEAFDGATATPETMLYDADKRLSLDDALWQGGLLEK